MQCELLNVWALALTLSLKLASLETFLAPGGPVAPPAAPIPEEISLLKPYIMQQAAKKLIRQKETLAITASVSFI